MRRYIIHITLCLTMLVQSCSNWLDVKPSDRVTEEGAFSTVQGFKQALNGIYIEMNQNALYGRSLGCEFLDILAQYYAVNSESPYYRLSQYEYADASSKSKIENIWGTTYNLIANTNLILKNCELKREILPDDYYALIKGEAIALRAMLHFDLFRLFGPMYDKDIEATSIPYYTEFSLEVNPSLSAKLFLENVIRDLETAAEILKEDPVIVYGPGGDRSDIFKSYRNLRLNYYAVKGLLARVYLYAQENEKALRAAQQVIEVQEKWFPWIKAEAVTQDRIFSTEILFALQNLNRLSLYQSLFNGEALTVKEVLIPRDDVIREYFESSDYRYISSFQSTVIYGTDNYRVFGKYTGKDSLMYQMIPLIRVSEMYYIAAETMMEIDRDSAYNYIKTVREHRGVLPGEWEEYDFDDGILTTQEYYREFFGEGQLFFYYKRNKMKELISPLSVDDDELEMNLNAYVLPIPDGELKYN